MPLAPRPLEERFWEKVLIVERADACWLWQGSTMTIRVDGTKHARATRVSYELGVDLIPDGMRVGQTCGNKRCVRPTHLSLGKQAPIGSAHPRAKLTEGKVIQIIRDLRAGAKMVHVADEYGVSPGVVSSIAHRKTWRHVKAAPIEWPPKKFREKRPRKRKYSPEQIREIRRRVSNGDLVVSIAKELGEANPSNISRIANRRRYKDVK